MATLNQFNPVQAFTQGRQNALSLQSQEQAIAREREAAPVRNQLAQLKLEGAQRGAAQQETQFDQKQAMLRAKGIYQSASAMLGLPQEQRAAAFPAVEKFLEEIGIPAGTFDVNEATDENLQRIMAEAQGLIGDPDRLNKLQQAQLDLVKAKTSAVKSGGNVKPTASKQDFETYKTLLGRAEKTGDPLDAELAKKFGVQAGFDRLTAQELADIDVDKTSKKELVKKAATASKEAFDSLKGVRKTIANMTDAIATLDKGAETGPIISKLPSFRQAAIELDNIKGRMGLDVVGATTFGALSESELAFALNVALPDSLEPVALKKWLVDKKAAQTKLANELRKAASFLGTPGNTIADYIEIQEKKNAGKNVKDMSDDELFQ